MVSEPSGQVEEAQEDDERVPRSWHAIAHTQFAAVSDGRYGRRLVLVPRQRRALGRGGNGRRFSAAAAAVARPPTWHGAVVVAVQPGRRAAAQLHGPFQWSIVERVGPAVAPVPARVPRHGARLAFRSDQRERLASTVQLTGQ